MGVTPRGLCAGTQLALAVKDSSNAQPQLRMWKVLLLHGQYGKSGQMHFLGEGFLSFPALGCVRGEQTQDLSSKHLLLLIIIVVIILVVVVVVIKQMVGGR